jgi:diguanylate cyclase (GGDEF)-like protein
MPHLECPRCRLGVDRSASDRADNRCPRCGESLQSASEPGFERGAGGLGHSSPAQARGRPALETAAGLEGNRRPAAVAAGQAWRRTGGSSGAIGGAVPGPRSATDRVTQLEAEVRRLEAKARRLAQLAHTDALTGLPNRRALEQALARELARAKRLPQPLCLAMIDLDHFKAVNDTHGHQTGDRLLREATAAWDRQLRAEDVLARNDGDEFTVLLANCPLEAASELIERLRAATPEGQTCSAGVVGWDGSEAPEALIARADRALYAAKHAGRDLAITAHP